MTRRVTLSSISALRAALYQGPAAAAPASSLIVPSRLAHIPPGPTRAMALLKAQAQAQAVHLRPLQVDSPYPHLFDVVLPRLEETWAKFGITAGNTTAESFIHRVRDLWRELPNAETLDALIGWMDLSVAHGADAGDPEEFVKISTQAENFAFGRDISQAKEFGSTSVHLLDVKDRITRIVFLKSIGDSDIRWLRRFHSYMETYLSLNFTNCGDLSDSGIDHLSNVLSICTLNLSRCRGLSGRSLGLACRLPHLRVFALSQCGWLDNAGLAAIGALTELRILNISKNPGITDEGARHLAGLVNLTELTMTDCPGLTDETLETLTALPSLKKIRGIESRGFTPSGRAVFRRHFPQAEIL